MNGLALLVACAIGVAVFCVVMLAGLRIFRAVSGIEDDRG